MMKPCRRSPAAKRGQDAETNRQEISRVGEISETPEGRFSETPDDARGRSGRGARSRRRTPPDRTREARGRTGGRGTGEADDLSRGFSLGERHEVGGGHR